MAEVLPKSGPHALPARPSDKRRSSFGRLSLLLRPHIGKLSITLAMLFGLSAVNIFIPQMVALVFNRVFPDKDWFLLALVLFSLLLLFITRNWLFFHGKYTAVNVGENLCFLLRRRLFERLQQMSLSYYRSNNPGQVSSRVMNDTFVVQSFIQDELPKLLQSTLLFVGILIALFVMNWQLALAATIVLPLHLATYFYFKGPIKAASKSASQSLAEAQGNLIEKFLGMEVVKGFTAEERENEAFKKAILLSRRNQLEGKRYHVLQKVVGDLLVGAGTLSLIAVGAFQVIGGNLQAGGFIAFFMYVRMLYPTILELMGSFAKMTKASASIDRVFELLEDASSREENRGRRRTRVRGRIEFREVAFAYKTGSPVLRDVSFTVEPGKVCAIMGSSGAGKTSMLGLLPRFNEPSAGTILLDGHPLPEYDLRCLRAVMGIVFQDCFLFSSTIMENLQYARKSATREEVEVMAEETGADRFIRKLENGYDTLVGDGGVALSRGEMQLITLTRAMIKDPSILLLDEATASLDRRTEDRIIPAILELMRGKTTLIVTHNTELLRHADQVIMLEEGIVVDA